MGINPGQLHLMIWYSINLSSKEWLYLYERGYCLSIFNKFSSIYYQRCLFEIINILIMLFKSIGRFSKNLDAHKYMKSISQKALLFKPSELRQLSEQQTKNDRVVKAFFNNQSEQIKIFQAKHRIINSIQKSSPSHSFYKVLLPFEKNTALRNKFTKFYTNGIRIGRMLEIMDYIGASVGYRYCSSANQNISQTPQFSIVTACVDQINFFHPVASDKNCTFSGYVTYAGSSSIQVQIDVKQGAQNNNEILNCTASFVMVARDKINHGRYNVPMINLQNEDHTTRISYELGHSRQQKRKESSKKSLASSAPSVQQSRLIHDIFLKSENQVLKNVVQISQTKLQKILLMHSQNRNLHGKIFGGYIMRQAFELGFLCAYMFLKGTCYPEIYHIDDIQFLSSVDVGSSIKFQACVGYVSQNIIHVIVKCTSIKPDGTRRRTNELRLSFLAPSNSKQTVIPYSYDQAMLYLQAKRAVDHIIA